MIRFVARVIRRGSIPLLLVVGVVTTVPGNWLRVQNVDPEFMMVLVQRTIHFGGTFFSNAVQVHGPLEPFLYDIAARLGGRNGAWYVISAMVTLVSIVLAYVAARTARFAGAAREIGIVVGAAVFVHFAISRSDYAGVLYIRNMTTLLLAVVWLLVIDQRVWSSPRRTRLGAIAIGCLLGLALQSLLSTFAAGVLGLVGLGVVWSRAEIQNRVRTAAYMVGAALVTFVSAPIYYAIRGDFTEFWSGWVSYGHVLAVAPGHSTATQFRNGWTVFVRYYTHRPLAWVVILAFAVTVGIIWKSAERVSRIVHLGLLAWWIAAWIELVFSQRYSAEYFVVSSVPTAFMAASVIGHIWRVTLASRVPARALIAVPLVGAVCAVALSGLTSFDNDVRAAWRFRGVNANATAFDSNRNGHERTALAVLDLVSRNGDPALIWTNNPWPYLNLKRVPAALFYRSYLLGQVYLGRTSTAYVLPHTWSWFAREVRQSKPVAYVRDDPLDPPRDIPFGSYVDANFDLVLPEPSLPVSLRHAAARQVLEGVTSRDWEGQPPAVAHTGWSVAGTTATYHQGLVANADDGLTLSLTSCFRLDGEISAAGTDPIGHVRFQFTDNFAKHERVRMSFDGKTATSSSDFADFEGEPTTVTADQRQVPFSIVVGRRSAALVLKGQVRSGVLLSSSVTVRAEATTPSLVLSHLRLGPPPAGSGC